MSKTRRVIAGPSATAAVALAAVLPVAPVTAFEIDSGNPDLQIHWDNTVKYTAGFRTKDPDPNVSGYPTANPNTDFGDLDLQHGMINDRVDWLSEFDISARNYGARVSGDFWYDTVYNRSSTDFPTSPPDLPNTIQALQGAPNNQFPSDTKILMGRYAEADDAFIWGSTQLENGVKLSGRLGRFVQLYGETLFLGANGIAYAQGPVDLIKAFSLPSAQFKDIALPVPQASGSVQINPNLSVGAYYQFEWRSLRLPPAGSYFNAADFIGEGGNLLLGPNGPANRIADQSGSNTGNYGGQVKFKIPGYESDYGVYAARYDEKGPIPIYNVTDPNGEFGAGTYRLVYARGISVYGASFSTLWGETNVAGEVSTRRNTPLHPVGDLVINFNNGANNTDDTAYARGNTLHANLSAISLYPATALWQGASFVGELAYNQLLSVTDNPTNPAFPDGVLNTTHTRSALATRFVFQPEYFQVFPGVDLQVPITIGYGIFGRSPVFQVAPYHGGDMNIGFNFDYRKTWRAGLQYTHFYGAPSAAPNLPASGPLGTYASYKQYYADRDFVALTIQRTF